jgi:hypothetical protein
MSIDSRVLDASGARARFASTKHLIAGDTLRFCLKEFGQESGKFALGVFNESRSAHRKANTASMRET